MTALLAVRLADVLTAFGRWRIRINGTDVQQGQLTRVPAGQVAVAIDLEVAGAARRAWATIEFETHLEPGRHVELEVPSRTSLGAALELIRGALKP